MNINKRTQFNPFLAPFYVLVEGLVAGGITLKFGDTLPPHVPIHCVFEHYNHGATGTKEELDSLNDIPLQTESGDLLRPIARFTIDPYVEADKKEREDELGGTIYSKENALLLKNKKDIIAYAAIFKVELTASAAVSMAAMVDKLDVELTGNSTDQPDKEEENKE